MSKRFIIPKSCLLRTSNSDNRHQYHHPADQMADSISPSTPLLLLLNSTSTATSSCSTTTEDSDDFSPESSSRQFGAPIVVLPPKPNTPHIPNNFSSSYKLLSIISDHSAPVSSLAVCGEFLLSASNSNDIIVYQQPTLHQYAKFGSSNTASGSVKSLIAVGNRVFTAHQDSLIRVWKVSSKPENGFRLTATMPTTRDYLGKFMKQSNYVQTRRHHKKLWIEHADSVTCLAVGGGFIYSGSWDKCVKVWRVKDLKCLESIQAHDDAVSALALGGSVGLVFSASADGKIKAWGRDQEADSTSESSSCSHRLQAVLDGGKSENTSAAVPVNTVVVVEEGENNNGNGSSTVVVYGGRGDGYVMGWQMIREEDEGGVASAAVVRWSKKLVCEVKAHERAVLCMCVRGKVLCTGSANKSIGVWRMKVTAAADHGEGGRLERIGVISGHDGPVKCLQASHGGVSGGVGGGFLLYSGSLDKSLRVWWVSTPPCDDNRKKKDEAEAGEEEVMMSSS